MYVSSSIVLYDLKNKIKKGQKMGTPNTSSRLDDIDLISQLAETGLNASQIANAILTANQSNVGGNTLTLLAGEKTTWRGGWRVKVMNADRY